MSFDETPVSSVLGPSQAQPLEPAQHNRAPQPLEPAQRDRATHIFNQIVSHYEPL